MKLQINLLIGIAIILNSCKTFKGNYCTLPNDTGACIEFLNKKELLYHFATDYGYIGLNYGKYRVKKDTIIVDFINIPDQYKLKSNEKYEITRHNKSSRDSTNFKIKCIGTWVANIYCKDTKKDSIVFGNTTNLDGEINFDLPNKTMPIILIAEYQKSKVQIPIDEVGDYEIKITLNELRGSTSYNRLIGTTRKFVKKTNEKGYDFFQQIGDEKWGKYYKYE